jgi:hypothetical protein
LLISGKSLVLSVLEHLEGGIIEPKIVDDVKPDSCVESCLGNLLGQTEFLLWWLDRGSFRTWGSHGDVILVLLLVDVHGNIFSGILQSDQLDLMVNVSFVVDHVFVVNHFNLEDSFSALDFLEQVLPVV